MHAYVHGIRLIAGVLGLLLVTGAAAFAQGSKAFVGVWELDRFKSVYDPITTAPERRILTLEADGSGIKSSTRTWRNSVANDVTYTAGFDGADYPTAAAGATVSFKQINERTVERTAKLNGQLAETARWEVSQDGRTLTITTEGTDTAGTPYSSTQIYTKQS